MLHAQLCSPPLLEMHQLEFNEIRIVAADVLAVVVTNNGVSDRSTQTWLGPAVLHIQIRRQGAEFLVDAQVRVS